MADRVSAFFEDGRYGSMPPAKGAIFVGRTYAGIDQGLRAFIEQQRVFFVATAPLGTDGHVNLSPKGLDSFRILDPTTVAYLDLTGSGVETIAHLRENGRITILFCAFEGPPKLVRLSGRGEVIEPGQPGFASARANFPALDGARAVIRIALDRITDSCGYGVPLYRFERDRSQLPDWTVRKGAEGVIRYQADHNARSIDGLPGLSTVSGQVKAV